MTTTPKVAPAVRKAVRESLTNDDTSATARLAIALADQIDNEIGKYRTLALEKLAPKLLDCLVELHLTPRSRSRLGKGGGDTDAGRVASKLDELRKRRESRAAG